MVWAQYGQDLNAEHNTKIKRPHVWLEQDNDLGIQFRVIDSNTKEFPAGENVGVGLVTDSWNQTNWIWQKVQIEGDTLRAKYWPAENQEPQDWVLECKYDAKGDRFGLRINSGSIRVAYFAADTNDINPQTPPAYLFAQAERITNPNRIALKLFTNSEKPRKEQFNVSLFSENKEIHNSELLLEIPKGHGEHSILLTAENTTSKSDTIIKLSEALPQGSLRIVFSNPTGSFSAERSVEIMAASKLTDQFKQVEKCLTILQDALKSHPLHPKRHKALQVVAKAAEAHLNRAKGLYDSGLTEESESSLSFALEALNELRGYKGAWLQQAGVSLDLDFIPPNFSLDHKKGQPKYNVDDFYSMDYVLLFHKLEFPVRSMVMGRSYEIEISWGMEGKNIDRDFNFDVRLVSPLGDRVVAQSNVAPEIPTSQWKPGKVYKQRVTLNVLAEDAVTRPEQPVVLDERQ